MRAETKKKRIKDIKKVFIFKIPKPKENSRTLKSPSKTPLTSVRATELKVS